MGDTNFKDNKRTSYAAIWKFIGLFILVGLCVGAGLMFCLITGIYMYVPLSFSILAFNKQENFDAFSDGFALVNDY